MLKLLAKTCLQHYYSILLLSIASVVITRFFSYWGYVSSHFLGESNQDVVSVISDLKRQAFDFAIFLYFTLQIY